MAGMASGIGLEDIAVSEGNDQWVRVGNDAFAYHRSGITGVWSITTLPSGPVQLAATIIYDPTPVGGRFIVFGTKAGPIPYVATSSGTGVPAWTDRSAAVAALTGYANIGVDTLVANRTGTIVGGSASVNQTRLLRSVDGGVSWALSGGAALVSDTYTVGYNPILDQFLAHGIGNFGVYTSPDGNIWTLAASPLVDFVGDFANQFFRVVGSLGRVWVVGGELGLVRWPRRPVAPDLGRPHDVRQPQPSPHQLDLRRVRVGTDGPDDKGAPSRVNPAAGHPPKHIVGSVGVQVEFSAVVGGVVGEVDANLGGRLFVGHLAEFPGASPPAITNPAAQTSVQRFTPVKLGHYLVVFTRPAGGRLAAHVSVES